MKAEKLELHATRLFEEFAGPLVLGGAVSPRRFFSGTAALNIGEREPRPEERYLRFQDARLRVARTLLPLDRVPPLGRWDWALLACVSDLTLALHPTFRSGLRDTVHRRVLPIVLRTIEQVPHAATLGELIARHTLLARLEHLSRTDTKVKWWTGSKQFEGTTPPKRLLAWPDARRVHVSRKETPFFRLVNERSTRDIGRPITHRSVLNEVLLRSPLTRLLSASLGEGFKWHPELVFWLERKDARTLLLRALRNDEHASDHLVAFVEGAAFASPEVRSLVNGFAVEWGIDVSTFTKVDPFAAFDDRRRSLFRPIEGATKDALSRRTSGASKRSA